MDNNVERYLIINEGYLIDSGVLQTLLEKEGIEVETVESFIGAAKKLRSNSYTCTLISADEATLLTQLRSTLSDQLTFVLHDGSYTPSKKWIVHEDSIHVLQYDTYNLEQTVSQIRDIVAEAEINTHLTQYITLETTIRHILSSIQAADSREEIETTVCKQLTASGLYTTGWISSFEKATDTLTPDIAVGIDSNHLTSTSLPDRCTAETHVDGDTETGYTVTVPLHHETDLFGTLSLTTFRTIDDAERDLLRELGDDLTTAIQRVTEDPHHLGAEKALETYAQSFSHELRNHLQTAKAELQADRGNETNFESILDVLERIERLDQDALYLTQQSIDDEQLSSHSLAAIIDEIQTRIPKLADQVEMHESDPIIAHRPLLELLLENLLRNALDHAGTTAQIHVGGLEDGFFVEDTGDGLPDVPVRSLFEWETSVDGNSGIGLAIVKRVVDLHGWEIAATESAHGGARFEITCVTSGGKLASSELNPDTDPVDQ